LHIKFISISIFLIFLIFAFTVDVDVFGGGSSGTDVSFWFYNWTGFDTGANISQIKDFEKFNSEGLLTQVLFDHHDTNGNFIKGLASNGTPIFKFNNSDEPRSVVIAGTHGNEYPSEAAAFKLINTLYDNKDKIKGTIYVIPLSNPKAALEVQREYFGYDPNRVANNSSTFSGHVVNEVVLKENISYVGDFHTMYDTRLKLIFAASGYPKSEKISKFITNKTNSEYFLSPNKGTITVTCAEHNLSSFTAEVEDGNNYGIILPNRDQWSYEQMLAYLDYTQNYVEDSNDFSNHDSSDILDMIL
jgi:predicted deacylase